MNVPKSVLDKIYQGVMVMSDEEFRQELDKYAEDEFTLQLKAMGECLLYENNK